MSQKPESYSWKKKSNENSSKAKDSTTKKSRQTKVMSEATELPMHDYTWGEALDSAFFTALTIRLTTPIRKLPSYRLGLINTQGKILRQPQTKEERRALSHIDQIALFMRQSMGGRVAAIMNMYRKQRMQPNFIKAAARAMSLRFNRYYDMKLGFFDRPDPQAITGGRGATQTSPGKPRS